MKPAARVLVLLALAALPAAGRADDAVPIADRSEQAADARGIAGLDVENARGRVVVRRSADGRIHVVATRMARMSDPAAARRYLAETVVESGPQGGRYVVTVRYPRRIDTSFRLSDLFTEHSRHRLSMPSLEAVLEIAVPERLPVRVHTVSGDVDTEALAGAIEVGTTSGDVRLSGDQGPAVVETVSGDVSVGGGPSVRIRTTSGDVLAHDTRRLDCRSVSGDVTADGALDSLALASESGDLEVAGAAGGIEARTSSGGIRVGPAGGRVRLTSASGDIRVTLARSLRSADLSTASGGITAELAPGLGAQLTAGTGSGSIDCRATLAQLRNGPHSLEGRIGPGGPPIRLHSGSGDLTVTSGGK